MAVAHRIYASALFSAAKEGSRLAQVHEELADFVAATRDVPELRALLNGGGIAVRSMHELEPSLEDVFIDLSATENAN